MTTHHVVHRYLADCNLPHEPFGPAYQLGLPYEDLVMSTIAPATKQSVLADPTIEGFQYFIDETVRKVDEEDILRFVVLVYAMAYSKVHAILEKPELIPEIIAIADAIVGDLPLESSDKMCLTGNHDVLVRRQGVPKWVPIPEVSLNDEVACMEDTEIVTDAGHYGTSTVHLDNVVWRRPSQVLTFDCDDNLDRYHGGIQQTVTKCHRIYHLKDGKGRLTQSSLLRGKKVQFRTTGGQQLDPYRRSWGVPKTTYWCKLIAYIAVRAETVRNFVVIPDSLQESIDPLMELLGITKVAPQDGKYYYSTLAGATRESTLNDIWREIHDIIESGKFPSYFWSCNREQSQTIVDAIIGFRDVTTLEHVHPQSRKKLCDEIQILMFQSGTYTGVVKKVCCGEEDDWGVALTPSNPVVDQSRQVFHCGNVYCLTVPGGKFYVRAPGSAGSWTGNSS